jgi:chaperonin GroEL
MDSSKEIKIDKEVRDGLRDGVNKLANTVLTTMGPMGSTVIIADGFGEPYITKDGVSVSNYITLADPIENIAATLLKQVAQNTVDQAGDGTTTSICLAQAFINKGFDLLDGGMSYNDIKTELEDLEEKVVKKLIAGSKKLKHSNIIDVATISANNDKNIGKLIQDAYEHSNIVRIEEGSKSEDELITINGMQLQTSYFDKAFINNGEKQSIEYSNIPIILINGKLERLEVIAGLLKQLQSVIIVADHFSEQVTSILRDNYNRGALNIGLVKSPGFGQHRKDLMKDLALYTGASLLLPSKEYIKVEGFVGKVDKISVQRDKTIIAVDNTTDELSQSLTELTEAYLRIEKGHDRDLLEQRIINLTGKISLIKVGGKSEVEMKERKDRIEDAVLAVHSALEEGIVEGGGCALYRISINNKFSKCLGAPLQQILYNGADFKYLEDTFKLNIIDPLKVTRCALENAISVSKTILSTRAVVLNERLWK